MKFAHIADLHIGREQFHQPFRYEDYVKAFREAVEKSVREGVEFILIAGDLFHISRPSPKALRDVVEILEIPRKKRVPVFAIEGNHDKTIRETSVFDLLEHLGLIYLVGYRREPRSTEFQRSEKVGKRYLVRGVFDDVEVYGLRHHNRWQLIRGNVNVLRTLFRGRKGILMLHQAIDYLSRDTPYHDAVDLRINELPETFSYYALGHIHVRRLAKPEQTGLNGPIAYPGSPERTDIREASHLITYLAGDKRPKLVKNENGVKGFYIVEDFQPEFITINARPFYYVRIEGHSTAELRRKVEEVAPLLPKDSMAVFVLEGSVKGGVDLTVFYNLLKEYGVKYYAFRSKILSEAIPVEGIRREELLTGWERELFLHLRVEPNEFLKTVEDFLQWLMERYTKKTPEKSERKSQGGKKGTEKRTFDRLAKRPSSLDAWLGRGT